MGFRRGFTLIELLVVIAILTLLLSLLITGLGRVRKVGAHTRELAGASQLNMAYLTYANDNRDMLMPGYLKYSWAHPNQDPAHQFWVWDDLSDAGTRMEGDSIKPYSWRIAPYVNYDTRALILDKKLWEEIRALPLDPPTGGQGYQRHVATNPSFGLNTTYVGGDYERGGFQEQALRMRGRFYVTKASEPIFPNRLIIFSTARGALQATGQTSPGWFRVDAPVVLNEDGRNAVFWATPYWEPEGAPPAYGWLDLRHFDKAITTNFDGHCESLTNRQLRDMRRWSNQADRANWIPTTR